jgi:hypothetical protein
MRRTTMTRGLITLAIVAAAFLMNAVFGNIAIAADKEGGGAAYDESAYTQYVQDTMQKLDKLYLQFCGTCGVSGDSAEQARREYAKTSRELMQHMNARFDRLDPKKGDALSQTEVLVNIHALTMMVDILTATYMENVAEHPYK